MTVASDYAAVCELVAEQITRLVHHKPNAVLGLATGSTPLGVYQRLVQNYQNGHLDFAHVTCFNLDEYFPMLPHSPHSYHFFMYQHLFRHINCSRWFVPDGAPATPAQVAQRCKDYEAQITEAGGIDLQLLGIGRTGHIGFNEPGSSRASRTRLVSLAPLTRDDAAAEFGGLAQVPVEAVSMGIGTILEAQEIVVMASGSAKAGMVASAVEGEQTAAVPASWLQSHPSVRFCLDQSAAARLQTSSS